MTLNRAEDYWWDDIPTPPTLAELMERVCAATDCHLRLARVGPGAREGEFLDARVVGQEWANQFSVRGECATGHMAIEAGIELMERIKVK